MADAFAELSKHDKPLDLLQKNHHKRSGIMPPDDDVFETPPTTPPPSNTEKQPSDSRAFPPPNTELCGINKKKRPCSDVQPMKPPPMRRLSREKFNVHNDRNTAAPTPPPEAYGFLSRSRDMSGSFDNISTISSSITSASPAWTSPNTSFCTESLATSFDSTAQETDTTIRPLLGQLRSRYPSDQSSLWSIGNSKDDRQNRRNVSLSSVVPAPSLLLKKLEESIEPAIDVSGATDIDMTYTAKASTEAQGKTQTSIITDLAKRLTSTTPFGISIHYMLTLLVNADVCKLLPRMILQLFHFDSSTKSSECLCMVD